jgi:hypothetical protein
MGSFLKAGIRNRICDRIRDRIWERIHNIVDLLIAGIQIIPRETGV